MWKERGNEEGGRKGIRKEGKAEGRGREGRQVERKDRQRHSKWPIRIYTKVAVIL